ncbi:hypothetical protein EV126DRAFT_79639 [Verticillium dahliae]|nr:hypothetical protein EV126DRAFT_79639 [Verticillium dahliae]
MSGRDVPTPSQPSILLCLLRRLNTPQKGTARTLQHQGTAAHGPQAIKVLVEHGGENARGRLQSGRASKPWWSVSSCTGSPASQPFLPRGLCVFWLLVFPLQPPSTTQLARIRGACLLVAGAAGGTSFVAVDNPHLSRWSVRRRTGPGLSRFRALVLLHPTHLSKQIPTKQALGLRRRDQRRSH